MNVGPAKGRIVTDLIAATKPNIMVELGGYIGYSCILFGAALREASGGRAKYFSLERNPEFAAVTMCLVELAGLRDNVHVVVGPSDESLRRLKAEGAFAASKDQEQQIDLMFLDHYKPAYRTDLQLCEELGLIQKGTVLAGDNCIEPGNPPYLEYVRASCADKRRFLEEAEEEEKGEKEEGKGKGGGSGGKGKASQWDDRMADSAMRQYEKREGEGTRDMNVKGVPGIVYESGMVESFEPTGERVSLVFFVAKEEGLLTIGCRMVWKLRSVWGLRGRRLVPGSLCTLLLGLVWMDVCDVMELEDVFR